MDDPFIFSIGEEVSIIPLINTGTVIDRRETLEGVREYLVHYTVNEEIHDEWFPEDQLER
jgi:hypothetical protein